MAVFGIATVDDIKERALNFLSDGASAADVTGFAQFDAVQLTDGCDFCCSFMVGVSSSSSAVSWVSIRRNDLICSTRANLALTRPISPSIRRSTSGARVDIPSPVGRGVGADKADMRAASRALWREIEAGRVPRQLFTQRQLDEIRRGKDKVSGLTWHHDGTSLNPDGTGPMLLLDERAHKTFGHVGWASTINE